MKTEKDYEELLKLFNKHKVKYCIIGAFATAFYALPRYTKDLDILVEPSLVNGKKIIAALEEFGFGSLNLSPEDFNKKNQIIQLGYEPVRIDLFCLLFLLASAFLIYWRGGRPLIRLKSPVLVKRVVDGDTLKLENGVSVRLIGIDAPELKKDAPECFAQEAVQILQALILEKKVFLETDTNSMDRFGRTLAYVFRAPDQTFLNQELLA